MRVGWRHAPMLAVLLFALVIDTMKPATLGFVLPGLAHEDGIPRETAVLLPPFALTGTTGGSVLWGRLADVYGRKASIPLSTILFRALRSAARCQASAGTSRCASSWARRRAG